MLNPIQEYEWDLYLNTDETFEYDFSAWLEANSQQVASITASVVDGQTNIEITEQDTFSGTEFPLSNAEWQGTILAKQEGRSRVKLTLTTAGNDKEEGYFRINVISEKINTPYRYSTYQNG